MEKTNLPVIRKVDRFDKTMLIAIAGIKEMSLSALVRSILKNYVNSPQWADLRAIKRGQDKD